MIKRYKQKHEERLWEGARERYKSLSGEEIDKRWEKAQIRCQSFTKKEKEKKRQYYQERKQKLPEYRKNYYLTHKM